MKKVMKTFLFSVLMVLVTSGLVLAKQKTISKVEILDIEAPFAETSSLDVSGTCPDDADYRITNIEWVSQDSSGAVLYEVFVTLKPNIGYIFSGEIVATVNEKQVTSIDLVDEDKLIVSYLFTEKPTSTISDTTLKHRIISYYDKELGSIIPDNYRVRDGANQTFKIVPKEGYRIKYVTIDGVSVGSVSEYTFKKVKEGHTIRAFFEVKDEEKPLLKLLLEIVNVFKL